MIRPLGRPVVALAGLLLATEGLLRAASFAGGPMTFDVGPSTGAYLTGFTGSEERPPSTFRWTGLRASASLPVEGAGGNGTLVIRYARYVPVVARTHVFVSGQRVASFDARPGRFRVERLPVSLPAGRLNIDLVCEDPHEIGIAVDWVRFEGGRWWLPVSLFGPRMLVVGVFVLGLAVGWGLVGSLLVAATLALAQAAWAAVDPFGLAHVAARLCVPAVLLSALCWILVRRRPAGRWVTLVFLASYLLKGAGLFYPSYFYNDVRNNRRYVEALGQDQGTLRERSLAAQQRIGVAYPRIIGGKKYAFPYSPVFFLPFTVLPTEHIEEGMKHATVAASAAEVVVAFWLAGLLFGPPSGFFAAVAAAFLPIHYSRLLLALWSTLGGHLVDSLAIGGALMLAAQPESLRRLLLFTGLAQASLLTYIASLTNTGPFMAFFAVLERRLALRLAAVACVTVAVTVLGLYPDFTWAFLGEILPTVLRSGGTGGDSIPGLLSALNRIVIFYGYGYPALVVAGAILASRRVAAPLLRVVCAYALTFATHVMLRAFASGLFRDLKEMEFAATLVAVLTGASLEELWRRNAQGRLAAVLVTVGLVAFGLSRYREYLATWTALVGLPE